VISYLPAATITERPVGEREETDDTPWSPLLNPMGLALEPALTAIPFGRTRQAAARFNQRPPDVAGGAAAGLTTQSGWVI
jgi:hypothetical protein